MNSSNIYSETDLDFNYTNDSAAGGSDIMVELALLTAMLGLPANAIGDQTTCVANAAGLQAALNNAAHNGVIDIIKLVQGTYTGNFVYSSTENYGLTIQGGFTPGTGCTSRVLNPTNTVLNGNQVATALAINLGDGGNGKVTVEGITLRNGKSTSSGGGLAIDTGVAIVQHCRFEKNITTVSINPDSSSGISYIGGGGAAIYADATLTDNVFIENTSNGSGGALVGGDILTNNTFINNTSNVLGGAVLGGSDFINNTFSNNTSHGSGGAVFILGDIHNTGGVIFTGNTFSGNKSTNGRGGGVATVYGGDIDSNVFIGNTAAFNGGGVSGGAEVNSNVFIGNVAAHGGGISGFSSLTNNTFRDNIARGDTGQNNGKGGGAIYGTNAVNNSFTRNSAAYGGGLYAALSSDENSSSGVLANNLFWANTSSIGQGADLYLSNDEDLDGIPTPINLVANDFDQTRPSGFYSPVNIAIPTGNLNRVNPLFVASDNLHLSASSPVINKGDKTVAGLPITDIDGGPRIVGTSVDIGADEYPVSNISAPVATTNPATAITATGATLNGSVTSSGATATASFDFGTTTYGTSIAATPAQVYSSTAVAVNANKTGLTCSTTYHFRTKAVSSAGTGLGADRSFATLACSQPNSWLYPANATVIVDRPFALDLQVNTNNAQVASYDFKLTFDPTRLVVDTTYQNASGQCDQGVCPGSGALDSQMTVVNNDDGTLRLNGFDMEGKGPSNDLQLLVIHFRTRMTTGPTPITLTTVELATVLGDSLGLGAKGTTVTISPGRCGDADGNGVVNIVDALAIARNLVGLPPPPTVNPLLGDVNKSGNLNITDAMLIARHSVGLLVVGTCNIGQPL